MLVKTVKQRKEGQSVDDLITQVVIEAAQGGVEKIKIRYSVINDLIQSIQVVEKWDKTVITCKANVQGRIKKKSRLPGRTRHPVTAASVYHQHSSKQAAWGDSAFISHQTTEVGAAPSSHRF